MAPTRRLPEVRIDEDLDRQLTFMLARDGVTYAEFARRAIGGALVGTEPATYTMDGRGPSFVRDIFAATQNDDPDARDRLRRFGAEREAINHRVKSANFALSTSSASAVVPPGYRPELFVPAAIFDRPFRNAGTPVSLADATPINIPAVTGFSGASASHVEGASTAEGTLTTAPVTINPTGIDGNFRVTRELYDSSSPAVDVVAVDVMTESYRRQTETLIYQELNGTNGQGGTITGGFTPSGAQVTNVAGATEATASAELSDALTRYPFRRGVKARDVLLTQAGAELVNGLFDDVTGDESALARKQGARVNAAPAATGNAAGDADVFVTTPADLLVFESPVLNFRYAERGAVAFVDLAIWAYFAVRLVRPVGLTAIRFN